MGYASRANPIAQAAKARSPRLGDMVDRQRVRELAGCIRSEAQLQQILADTNPAMREAVERAIRPWCTFAEAESV
jgi:hypothetical protein